MLPFGLIALCYPDVLVVPRLQYALLTLVMLGVFMISLSLLNWSRAAVAAGAMAGGAGGGAATAHRPVDSRGGCPQARLFLAQLLDERSRAHAFRDAERGGHRVDVLCPLCRTARLPGPLGAASAGQSVRGWGAVFLALGMVPALAGLEKTLTAINDEMAVLPLGLSRILGITTHLGIPLELPIYLMAIGALFLALGACSMADGRLPDGPRGMTQSGAGSRDLFAAGRWP